MANVIGLAPVMGGAIRMALLAEKPQCHPRGSWERQRVIAGGIREHATMGGTGLRKKGRPLALKAGGQAGLAFQLNCHGSGNAVQFSDISSHITAPSKSQPRGNRDLGPLA